MSASPTTIYNGSNHCAVRLSNGNEIYFSYRTCVAARIGNRSVRTGKRWSNTTTRHLSKMGVSGWEQVSQEELEKLAQ